MAKRGWFNRSFEAQHAAPGRRERRPHRKGVALRRRLRFGPLEGNAPQVSISGLDTDAIVDDASVDVEAKH